MEDWIANPEQAVGPLLFTAGFVAGFFGMYNLDHGQLMTKKKVMSEELLRGYLEELLCMAVKLEI